jgi:hypothetical protein
MNQQYDLPYMFHRSKALLAEIRTKMGHKADKVKLEEIRTTLELMYGQLALLEDRGRSGVDQNFDLHDPLDEERDGDLW